MTSIRLTNDIKNKIVSNCLNTIFKPKQEASTQLEGKLARACYNQLFTSSLQKMLEKIPKGWLREDNCLRFNADGWKVTLCLPKDTTVPTPYTNNCSVLGAITGELAAKVQEFVQERDRQKEEYRTKSSQLHSFLNNFSSLSTLKKAWPEGEPFYKDFVEPSNSTVPAIYVAQLNEALGLTTTKSKPKGTTRNEA